ncbi:MAG: hypothetical protein KZY74_18450 [Paenibacillaceae bacterium]|uniref:Uncharacterized protein n=1 Tax=Paenibacillus mellifer TaxID=2937794 RepID=A0A9X1Y5L3_9BACL|nr:hypothetical protein [Paenibacillus mellifer]MBW4841375.1 hypothetical protein [Paenibacillaceae bacterium]MCK8487762.1 hypothetical protein [Paenibacillus mellifer]
MAKDSKQSAAEREKTPKAKQPAHSKPAQDTEFAEELTKSDIQSAFQNPVTGEERLY